MLMQLAFSMICLALGASGGYAAGLFKVGWWFTDDTDAIKARESIKNLEDLTSRVSGQVEEHAKRVEDAQRELDSADPGAGEQPVTQAAEALRNANEQLQAELRKAKRDLEKQASELQSHRREARTDGLTQLLNRRAFDEEMDRLPQRILSTGTDASLLMMDIDHFKKFNDTYGHQLGDRVLKHVADVVRQTLLGMDVVAARYGGEEFAVIVSSSAHIAARVAEDIRAAVERAQLKHEGKSLSITLSLGLANTPTGVNSEELISRADGALYSAKRAGRNCGFYHNGEKCLPISELLTTTVRGPVEQPVEPVAELSAPPRAIRSAQPELANDAFEELEASLLDARQAAISGQISAERRRFERKPYWRQHLIAPIVGGRVPSPEMFEEVQFYDISSGGFGLLLASPPAFKNFIVQLEKADGTVYALAEVVRMRRAAQSDAAGVCGWEVGCRFTGKLQAPSAAEHASYADAT